MRDLAKYIESMFLVALIGVLLGALACSPWWTWLVIALGLGVWFSSTALGQQAWSMTCMSLSTVPYRLGSSAIIALGIAGVVGVLVAILAIGAGFEQTFSGTGRDDTVIMLNAGARSESGSSIPTESVGLIAQLPQIARGTDDKPLISPEQLMVATLTKRSTGLDARVAIRGVDAQSWALWPNVRLISGRSFTPGLRELVVGRGAQGQFAGLEVGASVEFDRQPWAVVGVFESSDAHESEIWADGKVVSSVYQRQGAVTSVTAKLTNPSALEALRSAISAERRLRVDVQTTRQYYSRQSESFTKMISIVGAVIGVIMAVGAIASAINATYSAVSKRAREIATLRAVGFRSVPVILSVLLETVLFAAIGGAIGTGIVWAVFDGYTAATAGAAGQVVFAFDVSQTLLWNGFKFALLLGITGSIFPALRAARQSICVGLRET